MDIRQISDSYFVTPQIEEGDMVEIARQGFTLVLCNRPDAEISTEIQAAKLEKAAQAAGLEFINNPLSHGNLTQEIVDIQAAAIVAANAGTNQKILAYCASGNRCTVLWALVNAGQIPIDDIIATGTRAGYQLEGLRGQLETIAGS